MKRRRRKWRRTRRWKGAVRVHEDGGECVGGRRKTRPAKNKTKRGEKRKQEN